ncbi:GIY-YIG nuclease family protein [Plantactinospora sp. WMMC1484]|uniref:GIY-YIG nuclease family protein n=1 Tax=Plantactinospora sp. WMMC1484 TaxID=3404122 RepID=UPI003BF5E773
MDDRAPGRVQVPVVAGAAAPGTVAPPPPVPPTAVPAPRPSKDIDIPLFGARGKARELAGQAAQLQTELERCRAEMDRLGVLSVVELERYRDELRQQIAEANARAEARKADLRQQEAAVLRHLQELRQQVVVTEETILLQEAGVYQYRHPLHDAVAYQTQLAALQGRIKAMARKDGGAVLGATNWTVNDSAAEGRRMVRDFSTLMLRAYNAEADNLVVVEALQARRGDRAADQGGAHDCPAGQDGAFGDQVVKIGMTRRLDPLDRVRELGDASVPFGFDVHALFFSEDAVGIESQMHHRLAARRVNRVNQRREFFYATPAEVRGHLMELAGNLLHFEEVPEALEYRQSLSETEPAAIS